MNIASLITRSVKEHPEKVAVRMYDEELTYSLFNHRARTVANYLAKNNSSTIRTETGLSNRVGLYLPNCPDYLVVMYATWLTGGITVPINYRFGLTELDFVIEDAELDWLVVLDSDVERLEHLQQRGVRFIVCGKQGDCTNSLKATANKIRTAAAYTPVYLQDIYQVTEMANETVAKRDNEDAMIMYTSGTTGRPKGVRQTHRNNTASAEMVIDVWNLTSRDHVLLGVPIFHVGGLQCSALPILFCGGTITLQPQWNAKLWIENSQNYKPTISGVVSTMMVDLVNYARQKKQNRFELDSYRFCSFGGSSTSPVICNAFESIYGIPLRELYGQTELSGLITTFDSQTRRVQGSMGKPMLQVVEVKVLDATTSEEINPGDNSAGVLYVRGDVVTPGYWKRDELNRERFQDGWLETGDIVHWDKDGYLHYADRLDDMIVSGGENIYPREVECILAQHPNIAEVVVIGTPDERWGEQVTAFVVPGESPLTEEGVLAFCRNHPELSGYKIPKQVVILDSLPRTGSGKTNKSLLKQMFA